MKAVVRRNRIVQQSGQAGLISLLVVMLIVGILAGMLYPQIAGRDEYSASGAVKGPPTPIDRAYDTACTAYMEQVSQAAFEYRSDHDSAPPDLESLKPYGVSEAMIDTPNCNFGLPKTAGQPDQNTAQGYPQPGASPQPAAYSDGGQYGYGRHRGGYSGGGQYGQQSGQQSGAYPGAPPPFQQPAGVPQQSGQPAAANPNPGYEVVGGVKVPTSSAPEGGADAYGQ